MNKFIRYHPRILIATAIGVGTFLALPGHWPGLSRVLVAWNVAVVAYLALIFRWMTSLSAEQICRRFDEEDESTTAVLVIVVSAAVLSLVAIFAMLATLRQVSGGTRVAHMALAALTLLSSWLLVPTVFTSRYAEAFYSAAVARRPLAFPATDAPVFWDFAYFSFTIACACQTSDVSTADAAIRRIVTAHTLISFMFNAAILGFAINVSAGLLGS